MGIHNEGPDSESIETAGTLRLYHDPPTPANVRQIYDDSTNILAGSKFTEDEIYDTRSLIYGCLRQDTSLTASEDTTVTIEICRKIIEEQVICKQGEPINYFYYSTGASTELLLARPKQLVVAKQPEVCGELGGDDFWDAIQKTDQYGRHDKAPWLFRRSCLDRLSHQCMAEMKSYPVLRLRETEKQRIL